MYDTATVGQIGHLSIDISVLARIILAMRSWTRVRQRSYPLVSLHWETLTSTITYSKEVGPDVDSCTTKIRFRARLKAHDDLT